MSHKKFKIKTACVDTLPHHASRTSENIPLSKAQSDHLLSKVLLATKVGNIGIWEYVFDQKSILADEVVFSHFGMITPPFPGNYKVLWELVHPDDKLKVTQEYKKALKDKVNLGVECRIIWKDGTLRHIKVDAVFQYDINGGPCSLIGSSQDITSQKLAAASLLESEAKFRTLYENIPDGLLLTITDGKILAANPAATEMFQMSEAEICRAGRFGLVDPSDPKLKQLIEERARNGRAKGEITCMRKDGSSFPAEITSVVFADANGQNRTSMMIRDLSPRRSGEKDLVSATCALQQALNDLNKIMNSSLDIICSINEEGNFVSLSSASERILGYLPGELLNTSFVDLVFAEDIEKTLNEGIKIRNGESVTIFENRYIHKDGSLVPLLWSAKWDDNDKLTYCIARDATEKKILEKAVHVERQRFLDLYSQAPSCMGVLKGPNHIYEMANPLYLQLIDKKDIIGKTVKEVLPELEAQGVFNFLDGVYNTGQTFSANEMLVKFDYNGNGQLVDTYLNFIYQAHRDLENNVDGIFFFAIDVTELVLSRKRIEESEKRYRQIVETAQEGIWLIDENNRTTFVNKKLCEIFDSSEEEMMGKEIYDFMDEEGKQLAADMIARKKDGEMSQKEFKYIAKSGREIWTNVSANPLFNEDDNYKGSLAMVTDITDRILLERKLFDEQINNQKEITKAAINAQEKERREIGEELHDNVNQLLATAKLFLSHSLNITDGYKEYIVKSQEFLTTAVDEIRKLTKALVGPAKETDMGLISSINELKTDIQLITDLQIEFVHSSYFEEDSDAGLKLVIYRIIQEQLNNILKHADATHITIKLKNEDDHLNLLIRDNGKGFDPGARQNGIGLQNIRHRAELYNGTMTINSSPGEGCAVSISFKHLQ